MALIKCPECGRSVSDTAKACPGCGYAVAEYMRSADVKCNKCQISVEYFHHQKYVYDDLVEAWASVTISDMNGRILFCDNSTREQNVRLCMLPDDEVHVCIRFEGCGPNVPRYDGPTRMILRRGHAYEFFTDYRTTMVKGVFGMKRSSYRAFSFRECNWR